MSATHLPGEQDLGVLERAGATATVRFRRQFPHPREKVWRALTQAEHLAAWFPTTIDGDLTTPGAPLQFGFRELEIAPMEGELLACEPPQLLEFVWGDETLRFELTASNHGTLLEFTATFAEIGKVARDAAGWHVCLDRLGYAVDQKPWPFREDDQWRLVHRRYVASLGPEASVIGPPPEWEEQFGPADLDAQ